MPPTETRRSKKRSIPRQRKSRTRGPEKLTPDAVMGELVELINQIATADHSASRPLRKAHGSNRFERPRPSAIGELLTIWHKDPMYLNNSGEPIALKMNGEEPSFSKLAERALPKMGVKKIFSELKAIGAISADKRGFIHAKTRSLSVYEDRRLAVQHTLSTLRGFIQTLRHNLDSNVLNSEQLFHRVAWNGKISLDDIPKLKIWLKHRGQIFLESADNWMLRRSRTAASRRSNSTRQVSVGLYLSVDHHLEG